jgi:hypothetical protein
LFKEEQGYRQETEDHLKVVAKYKEEGRDAADIRNAVGQARWAPVDDHPA